MDNYTGRRIAGRYDIKELIGVGGMANVYKAVDTTDETTVAVKILREEFYSNEEFLRRFKNESKAIAVLSHPNIIKVYDVCFSDKVQSIVMEYVDGITLKEYIEQQGALSWRDALHFVLQILRALSHAHEKGIVHRDMKPQNVMLLSDGSIKITDFGIARFARSEARTLTDRAIGSVHYISPEQARGEHTDQRADIYSVGVMLFEMLTGQLPFDAESPLSVALKQIQLEAPTPRSINPDIPEGLEEITVRAMQKDPNGRYQSAGEMLADIEAFRQDPDARFEYQYLDNKQEQGMRFRRAVQQIQEQSRAPMKPRGKGERPMAKRTTRREDDDDENGKGSVLMILAGITAAFVAISVAFIGTMLYLNNPLEKVPDIKVPDLLGLDYEAVRDAPEYNKFIFASEDTQYNDLYERGTIIDQNPKAGKTVKEKSTIKVVISNGKKIIAMPNLVGKEETAAYQELTDLELDYLKTEVFSEEPIGTVLATDPGAGSEVPVGTTVKLQISMGPENKMASVPDVLGMTLEQAKKRIEDAKLAVGAISYVVSDTAYEKVLSQDPASTSQIAVGGFVNLNVSGGADKKNQVTLSIPLPEDVTELVRLQAMSDGNVLSEARVQPSTAIHWRPVFQGTGVNSIFIMYNDFLYMTVEIDFNKGTWRITEDNSAQHT